jgi:hypothetical protein
VKSREVRDALTPWLGLIVGLTAWALTHQLGADGTFDDCTTFAPTPIVIVALLGVLASAYAGRLSWLIVSDGRQGQARKVIATIPSPWAWRHCSRWPCCIRSWPRSSFRLASSEVRARNCRDRDPCRRFGACRA